MRRPTRPDTGRKPAARRATAISRPPGDLDRHRNRKTAAKRPAPAGAGGGKPGPRDRTARDIPSDAPIRRRPCLPTCPVRAGNAGPADSGPACCTSAIPRLPGRTPARGGCRPPPFPADWPSRRRRPSAGRRPRAASGWVRRRWRSPRPRNAAVPAPTNPAMPAHPHPRIRRCPLRCRPWPRCACFPDSADRWAFPVPAPRPASAGWPPNPSRPAAHPARA